MKLNSFLAERRFGLFLSFVLFCIPFTSGEYISLDEPACRQDCFLLAPALQEECLTQQMEFYSYKLIKGVFNYGKTAIYSGLWNQRYEKSDRRLFENVFKSILNEYNNPQVLGSIDYTELNSTTQNIFEMLKTYSGNRLRDADIPYASYPSLACPIQCTNEIVTWQAMFYFSLAIFILCAITITLYSIFLRKQYQSLKSRLKALKYSTNS